MVEEQGSHDAPTRADDPGRKPRGNCHHTKRRTLWISLSWTAFTLVAVGARHWIGAASAIWLLTLSAITGGRLLVAGHLVWGLWQMVGSLVGLAALAFALRAGGFSGERRSADGADGR